MIGQNKIYVTKTLIENRINKNIKQGGLMKYTLFFLVCIMSVNAQNSPDSIQISSFERLQAQFDTTLAIHFSIRVFVT